ncbi:hypothetical protein [Natronobacterium gregoryi]|nr:hypothetical protein [Natronobacterium gregoryi]
MGSLVLIFGTVAALWLLVDAIFTALDNLLESELERRLEDEGRSS